MSGQTPQEDDPTDAEIDHWLAEVRGGLPELEDVSPELLRAIFRLGAAWEATKETRRIQYERETGRHSR